MADSLFLMERYQGSDSEVDSDTDCKLEKVLERAKRKRKTEEKPLETLSAPLKKKKKQAKEDLIQNDVANGEVEIQLSDAIAADDEEEAEVELKGKRPKKKKKAKQDKVQNKEEPADIEEEEVNQNDKQYFPIIKDVLDKKQEKVLRSLPEWLEKPSIVEIDVQRKEKKISDIEFLDDYMKANLLRNGVSHLFPVQTEVIPWLLQSSQKRLFVRPSDLCVSAPTGSGKTLAFVIPIVQSLNGRMVNQIRALVVLPVRDLALQVYKVFETFCKGTELQVGLVVGFSSFDQERKILGKNSTRGYQCLVDIVVATPGRLIDHIDRNPGFCLEHLRFLVIDEADRMMEEIQQGWLKKVETAIFKNKVFNGCSCFSFDSQYKKTAIEPFSTCSFPHVSEHVQKLFYSATLSQDPELLHELSLYQPKLFTSVAKPLDGKASLSSVEDDFIGKYVTPTELTEHYAICDRRIKPLVIWHIIQKKGFRKVLCFTHTLEQSHRLHMVLSNLLNDVKVRELSSNLTTIQRKIILEQFTSGKVNVLVCSDLMARGIDIEDIDCVISYEVPYHIKTYIHRIGRTARAGKEGVAVTLLEREQVSNFRKMLLTSGKVVPSEFEYKHSDLQPMEESFKNALEETAKTVSVEKRKKTCFKKGVSVGKKLPFRRNAKERNRKEHLGRGIRNTKTR